MSEERAQAKEKEKKEEQHLFLTIKVITDEMFSHHQGFDLAVFDKETPLLSDPKVFHVPKQTTYSAFKSTVAKHFSYPESWIVLWVLAGRRNKTVRPEARISEGKPLSSMSHEFCVGCF